MRHRTLVGFLVAQVVQVIGFTLLGSFILRLGKTLGFYPGEQIVLAVATLPGLVVGALAGAWAIDRVGPRRAIAITLTLAAAIALALPWVRTPFLLYACAVAAGAVTAPAQVASLALVANLARRGAVAETFGFFVLGWQVAAVTAWVLGDLFFRSEGGRPVGGLLLAGILLMALGLLLVLVRSGVAGPSFAEGAPEPEAPRLEAGR